MDDLKLDSDGYEIPNFLKRQVQKYDTQMVYDPMTNALYGPEGRLIKTLNCPMALRLTDLKQVADDSPDRFCQVCKKTVHSVNDLSATEVTGLVQSDPDVCVFATSDAKNVLFLKPIGVYSSNVAGLPVVKTARSMGAMDDAQKRGWKLIFRETGIENSFGEFKIALYQNTKIGTLWWSKDYRNPAPNPVVDGDDWRLVKDFFFVRPDRPMPIAAYLIPPTVLPGDAVYLEDVIEDRTIARWNQGDAARKIQETAIWDGRDIVFVKERKPSRLAQG